ncbi:hypothetical protein BU24DRAFT_447203 [Aaosphaeria arxii CBS 175.79]|uniref:Zn(2)-C6 fungal-type domain-containing protein n=1 Tax=Aaosphaeria arxii CBS 175.79 TaxID=1450172 RepID=A0A6A5YCW2_9PLEO|nr:uncharacterized protein BU24DRAFT_447203 [Aaosphaeria arxii CBS 175.79]KAF2022431.1 hypothetical protein BU24DRAFT_447203 [Aaosphaeria arxii CBS 175.79]
MDGLKSGSRRTHFKSRNGCSQCKRSRIKCDEQAPKCYHCRRRAVRCDFEDDRTKLKTIGQGYTQSVAPTPLRVVSHRKELQVEPAPLIFINVLPTMIMDRGQRDLFSHFICQTRQTLLSKGAENIFWNVDIPQQALKHDYLLNAILAFSALHRSYLRHPHDPQHAYDLDRSLALHQESVKLFNSSVTNITSSNLGAAYGMVTLSVIYSCGLAQVAQNLRCKDHVEQALAIMMSVYKARPLMEAHDQELKRTNPEHSRKIKRKIRKPEPASTPPTIKAIKLQYLLDQSNESSINKAILSTTITGMRKVEEMGGASGDFIDWIDVVPHRYLDLLQQGCSMALLILMAFEIDKMFADEEPARWFTSLWRVKLVEFICDHLGPLWQAYLTYEPVPNLLDF